MILYIMNFLVIDEYFKYLKKILKLCDSIKKQGKIKSF